MILIYLKTYSVHLTQILLYICGFRFSLLSLVQVIHITLKELKLGRFFATFAEPCPPYTESLKKNRFNTNLQFDTRRPKKIKKYKTRKRKITWFNPPPPPPPHPFSLFFSINVARNGCYFLTLIDRYFPKDKN